MDHPMAPPNVYKLLRYEDNLLPSRIVYTQYKYVPCYNLSANAIYWHFFLVLDLDTTEETHLILSLLFKRWDISYIYE